MLALSHHTNSCTKKNLITSTPYRASKESPAVFPPRLWVGEAAKHFFFFFFFFFCLVLCHDNFQDWFPVAVACRWDCQGHPGILYGALRHPLHHTPASPLHLPCPSIRLFSGGAHRDGAGDNPGRRYRCRMVRDAGCRRRTDPHHWITKVTAGGTRPPPSPWEPHPGSASSMRLK